MTAPEESAPQPERQRIDYQRKISELLDEYGVVLSDATVAIIVETLDSIADRFGNPDDSEYRDYHNDTHTYDTISRAFGWLKFLRDRGGLPITHEDFEVVALAAVFHDVKLKPLPGLSPEQQSANYASNRLWLENENGAEYDALFIERVENAVLSTAVTIDKERVDQIHVLDRTPDVAAIALAIADIGAIFVDKDPFRLIKDISNLVLERFRVEPFDQEKLMEIIGKQRLFLTQRKDDIAKYLDHLCGSDTELSAQLKNLVNAGTADTEERIQSLIKKIELNLSPLATAIEVTFNEASESGEKIRNKLFSTVVMTLRLGPTQAPGE